MIAQRRALGGPASAAGLERDGVIQQVRIDGLVRSGVSAPLSCPAAEIRSRRGHLLRIASGDVIVIAHLLQPGVGMLALTLP